MPSIAEPWLWAGFAIIVLVTMVLDLGVFHRKSHVMPFREALTWTGVWVTLAMLFAGAITMHAGTERGLEFLAGYLVEYALSVDNIFIFLVIFSSFGVPQALQHRVLFWGVLGAVVLRALMIVVGGALLTKFHVLIYLFGGFLLLTGLRMIWRDEESVHPERSFVFQQFRRLIPSTSEYHGERFLVREGGRLLATPMLLVLFLVEFTDVVFALDSIPAIFAITNDPFIVFTSNIFAILGLRSLYFVLAGVMYRFTYLRVGLGATLVFVGLKMGLADFVTVPVWASLGIVTLLIGGSIAYSLWKTRQTAGAPEELPEVPPTEDPGQVVARASGVVK